jgi:glucokinase
VIRKDRWPIRKNTRRQLYTQFEELIQHWHKQCSEAELVGVGIGVPGFINRRTGILDKSPNLSAVDGAHIFEDLESMLSLPAVIDNDANAAAWGEYWAGGGREAELLILITLGTGIGSGIVWRGEIWHGAAGYAGEFGHNILVPSGELCNCGNRGCVEAYFGASAMIREAGAAIKGGAETTLAALTEPMKGRHILDAAAIGDSVAMNIVRRGCWMFGLSLSSLINTLNPDQIVLGGGIIAASELIMPLIMDGVREHAIPGALKYCNIKPSVLGNDAGLIGSAGLAWKKVYQAL